METTDSHLAPVLADGTRVPVDDIERKVCEAVVLPDSPYNGQLIGELKLNELFGVRIMGLEHRAASLSPACARCGWPAAMCCCSRAVSRGCTRPVIRASS
ncbi:MAG: TrkA C-terminal domain-containing protein [Caldilineaceae bacterium]